MLCDTLLIDGRLPGKAAMFADRNGKTYPNLLAALEAAWPLSEEGQTVMRVLNLTRGTWKEYIEKDCHERPLARVVLEAAEFRYVQ